VIVTGNCGDVMEMKKILPGESNFYMKRTNLLFVIIQNSGNMPPEFGIMKVFSWNLFT
jgi:hypothetical protein